jgi:NADPH:quinone reductase-like Zn-dependent oxidoreductase/3-oxoacyl-(acyl-carrier-protein) synthase/2-polyprenyl-3-methyl-5-hydroxy-6-metoxy-1,4-benzoquinol methylase/acyl carrier protein
MIRNCNNKDVGNIKVKRIQNAVIGLACQFPGANNYHEFWSNLLHGTKSISSVPSSSLGMSDFNQGEDSESLVTLGLLQDKDEFDNAFFGISPKQAKVMDPQQRILLQTSWHCIEDSGIHLSILQKKCTAVYIGAMTNDYYEQILKQNNEVDKHLYLGNSSCMLANRISYFLNLTGESLTIETACSSSLVALHKAHEALSQGHCDYALVGGVNVICYGVKHMAFKKCHMLSKKGKISTFDQSADGYVPGEGVGVVLLTRLSVAKQYGYNLRAIICGSSVNHNGRVAGITVPDVSAQEKLIANAHTQANIVPEEISYIEAHGSGTSLGDPIEVDALKRVFKNSQNLCYLGSVKPNIGHLEAASGIAGLIKTILMLQKRVIPPQINFNKINPILGLSNSPFIITTEQKTWGNLAQKIRLAGVSSFGFGGVNAHVVLSEAVNHDPSIPTLAHSVLPFLLSAQSEISLKKLIHKWSNFCSNSVDWQQICAHNMLNKGGMKYRIGSPVLSIDEVKDFLAQKNIDSVKKIHENILLHFEFDKEFREQDDRYLQEISKREWFKIYYKEHAENLYGGDSRKIQSNRNWLLYIVCEYIFNKLITGLNYNQVVVVASGVFEIAALRMNRCIDAEQLKRCIDKDFNSIEMLLNLSEVKFPIFLKNGTQALTLPYVVSGCIDNLLVADYDWSFIGKRFSDIKEIYLCQKTYQCLLDDYVDVLVNFEIFFESPSEIFSYTLMVEQDFTKRLACLFCIELALKQLYQKWNIEDNLLDQYPINFKNLIIVYHYGKGDINDFLGYLVSGLGKFSEKKHKWIPLSSNYDKITKNFDQKCRYNIDTHNKPEFTDRDFFTNSHYLHISFSSCMKNLLETNEVLLDHHLSLWKLGFDVNWESVYPDLHPVYKPFPLYPFNSNRIWWNIERESSDMSLNNESLISTLELTADGCCVSLNALAIEFYSKGHIVNETQIVPAALIVSIFIHAMKLFKGFSQLKIENINFIATAETTKSSDLKVYILEGNAGYNLKLGDNLHKIYASAFCCVSKEQENYEYIENESSLIEKYDGHDVYIALQKIGLKYSGNYRLIDKLNLMDSCIHGVISKNNIITEQLFDFYALDASFQSTYFPVKGHNYLAIPYCIDSFHVYHLNKIENFTIKNQNGNNGDEISLYDKDGILCAGIKGFQKRPLNEKKYTVLMPAWEILAEKADNNIPFARGMQSSLIYSEDSVCLTEKILLTLEEAHVKSMLWSDDFSQNNDALHLKEISKIYYLCGILNSDIAEKITYNNVNQNALDLFKFLKIIRKSNTSNYAREIIIIVNGLFAVKKDELINPFSATYIGMLRSLQKEFVNWNLKLIDIPFNIKDFCNEADILTFTKKLNEIKQGCYAFRNNKMYGQVWKNVDYNPIIEHNNKNIRKNILIIGGAGGIGRELCKYLSLKNSVNYIIIGRGGYNENIEEFAANLKQMDSKLHYYSCDIRDSELLKQTLQKIESIHQTIDSIFHLPVILQDHLFDDMSEQQFLDVLTVKTACILIHAYLKIPVKSVVFYTSYLGYQANPGQCNYIAGCTFQDVYANWLKQKTKSQVSVINWGFWGTVGAVAYPVYRQRYQKSGYDSILPAEVFPISLSCMNTPNQYLILKHSKPIADVLLDLVIDNKTQQDKYKSPDQLHRIPEIERFLACEVLKLFHMQGIFLDEKKWNIKNIMSIICVLEKYEAYLISLLNHLVFHKLINIDHEGWFLNVNETRNVPENFIEKIECNSFFKEYIDLFKTAYKHCVSILQGKFLPTDIFFAKGKTHLVEGFYSTYPVATYFNNVLAYEIEELINELGLPEVKILELGAGTGSSTECVISKLAVGNKAIEYYYTDISRSFLDIGKKKFRNISFIKYDVLNIESLGESNLCHEKFDIVIATNVIHATRNILSSLNNIKKLIRGNGHIVLNELTCKKLYLDFVFGLFDGWWLADDKDRRIDSSPLMSCLQWQRVLEDAGFFKINIVHGNLKTEDIVLAGQSVITASMQINTCLQSMVQHESEIFPQHVHHDLTEQDKHSFYTVTEFINNSIIEILKMEKGKIEGSQNFSELGIDSIIGIDLIEKINHHFNIRLSTIIIFEYPTILALSKYIISRFLGQSKQNAPIRKSSSVCDGIDAGESQLVDAWWLENPIIENKIKIHKVGISDPLADEIQIQVMASGVNFADFLCMKGIYPTIPNYPFIPGLEVSGVIKKIGLNVDGFKIGDLVFGFTGQSMGGHADLVNINNLLVASKPNLLAFEEAAVLPIVYVTTAHIFYLLRNLKAGQTILIQSASGGLGDMLIQFSKRLGLIIYATASSDEKFKFLKDKGVDYPINYDTQDFTKIIFENTFNQGVDVVVNTLGGERMQNSINVVAPYGKYIETAMNGLKTNQHINLSSLINNQSYYSVDIRRLSIDHPELIRKYLQQLIVDVNSKAIKAAIHRSYPLTHIQDAILYLSSRKSQNKIVISHLKNNPTLENPIPYSCEFVNEKKICKKSKKNCDNWYGWNLSRCCKYRRFLEKYFYWKMLSRKKW